MSGWSVEGLEVHRGGFALGPVSLTLAEGEAAAVVGPNGAGKSTLLRGIAGLEPRVVGKLRDGDRELGDAPPERRGIGYLPPGLALFPHRTVLANVAYAGEVRGASEARAEARDWLGRFDLGALADRYPRTLSTGEQQRVAVARALAARPRLLLWDEPASALDVRTRYELHETLRTVRERERIPLIFVTHDPADAFGVADRFLRLEAGRVLRAGVMADFAGRPRSAFDARFLGFPNVFEPDQLRAASGALARRLEARAGAGGVAFSARAVGVGGGAGFEATLRRSLPRGDHLELQLDAGGLSLVAERTGAVGAPGPGPVRLTLDESALWALDAPGAGGAP